MDLCNLFSHLQNAHFDTDKNAILQNLNMLHFYGKLVAHYYTRLHLAKIAKRESVNPCHWECGLSLYIVIHYMLLMSCFIST